MMTSSPASPSGRQTLRVAKHFDEPAERVFDVEDGKVRVSREGVFDGAQKVANLSDLIQQTPRGDVLSISEAATQPPHSHWVRNILIGFAIVVGAAFVICLAARVCGPD